MNPKFTFDRVNMFFELHLGQDLRRRAVALNVHNSIHFLRKVKVMRYEQDKLVFAKAEDCIVQDFPCNFCV